MCCKCQSGTPEISAAIILTLLYPVIIFGNLLIIYIVSVERTLHKPMYILICNLACINLFDMSHVPYTVRVMLSLYFLILSPVLNPVIYGARTGKINEAIKAKIMNMK
ncbi:olfactory receptor 2D2-like [Sardina pilchardus]|uniref:olfactory receptor 2D2-like n=1 Tax=Sardina pilchardus TaxID=27697 RepID=UPI002E0F9C3B